MPLPPYALSPAELDAMRARVDAASPGPWRALAGARKVSIREVGLGAPPVAVASPLVLGNDEHVIGEVSPWIEDGDRDFIAHSRADMATLLAEVTLCHEALLGLDKWRTRLAERLDLRATASWVDILDAVDSILDNDPNLEE